MKARLRVSVVLGAVSLAAFGCSGAGSDGHGRAHGLGPTPSAEETHDHHALGSHGGHLVELGAEGLSAEVALDDKQHAVIVYLLGLEARDPAVGAAIEVRVQLFEDGQFIDYTLHPVQSAGDVPAFTLADAKLHDTLAGGHVRGRLRVVLDADEFTATLDDLGCDHDH